MATELAQRRSAQPPDSFRDQRLIATGNPAAINATAQGVLDDILTTGVRQPMIGGNFAGGYKVIAPNGRFAVYDKSGVFQYFGE